MRYPAYSKNDVSRDDGAYILSDIIIPKFLIQLYDTSDERDESYVISILYSHSQDSQFILRSDAIEGQGKTRSCFAWCDGKSRPHPPFTSASNIIRPTAVFGWIKKKKKKKVFPEEQSHSSVLHHLMRNI